ncbi:MAG TPA: 2Fe-2S iron-sulfur cluster-binding protein [Acidimicrobiales bacterium]|jgi:ferredoxin
MPQICFRTSGREVGFKDGDSVNLLRVAIRNECGVPWRCASGNCGTDRVLVEEGAGNLSTPRKRERDRLGDLLGMGYRLACQTYVDGDVTVSWDPEQKGLDEDSRAAERLKRIWLGASDTA